MLLWQSIRIKIAPRAIGLDQRAGALLEDVFEGVKSLAALRGIELDFFELFGEVPFALWDAVARGGGFVRPVEFASSIRVKVFFLECDEFDGVAADLAVEGDLTLECASSLGEQCPFDGVLGVGGDPAIDIVPDAVAVGIGSEECLGAVGVHEERR